QHHSGAFRQEPQRASEVEVLFAGDEGNDVAARRAGAEAMPALPIRVDIERWRLLVVERTVGLEVASRLLQPDVRLHHLDDIELRLDLVYRAHGPRLRFPAVIPATHSIPRRTRRLNREVARRPDSSSVRARPAARPGPP